MSLAPSALCCLGPLHARELISTKWTQAGSTLIPHGFPISASCKHCLHI